MVKQADFEEAVRLSADELHAFTAALFEAAGATADGAKLMADLLVDNDLHGASSHGTNLAHGWNYLGQMREGQINPRPEPKLISEEGSVSVWDGDGGCGHFA